MNSDDSIAAFKEAANYFSKQVSNMLNLQAIAVTVDTTDSYVVQKAGISNWYIFIQNDEIF